MPIFRRGPRKASDSRRLLQNRMEAGCHWFHTAVRKPKQTHNVYRQVLELSSKVSYFPVRMSGRRCVVTDRLQRGSRKYLHRMSLHVSKCHESKPYPYFLNIDGPMVIL